MGLPAARRKSLPATMMCQEAQFWCWAAVMQMIEAYDGNLVTQARIATEHVPAATPRGLLEHRPTTSGPRRVRTTVPGACNSPHRLSQILNERRPTAAMCNHAPSFKEITDQIDSDRPVPVRIEWQVSEQPDGDKREQPSGHATGSGHFVCIVGYADDGQGSLFLEVLDPLSPGVNGGTARLALVPFATFQSAYTLGGDRGIPTHFYKV